MFSGPSVAIASGITFLDALLPGLLIIALFIAVTPWVNRDSTVVRSVAVAFCLVLLWRYMYWRLAYTLPPIDQPVDFLVGAIFTGTELLAAIGTTATLIFMSRFSNRTAEADAAVQRLEERAECPLVDVFICTYNEEQEILERTIAGALALEYGNKRIWVLDDGRREWLRELCAEMTCGYITRDDNQHAKAGNINNALRYVSTLEEPPEYISILDADFVCQPQFLTRTAALMSSNPDVGIVQTPQHYSNADPIQANLATSRVWPDEQRSFFDIIQASKDAWGGAFCCGTSSVLRFSTLQKIGGFPTDSVTEDLLTTIRLNEIGYKTIYLNERLTVGLAPEGLQEYITQRGRWCLGVMQIFRGKSSPFSLKSTASLVDRITLCEAFTFWCAQHGFRLLGMIVLSLYLLFDIQAVYAGVTDATSHLFPYLVAQILVIGWLMRWRVMPIMGDLTQLLAAPAALKATFVGLLRPKGQKFKVTAKGGDRSQRFVQWPMMRIFLGCLALNVAGILCAFVLNPSQALADASALALFWSWFNCVVLVLACYVCIEQPRADSRASAEGYVWVVAEGFKCRRRAIDVSAGGIRMEGAIPLAERTPVEIGIGDDRFPGFVVRCEDDHFAVQFERKELAAKAHLDNHNSTPAGSLLYEINPMQVLTAVAARAFR